MYGLLHDIGGKVLKKIKIEIEQKGKVIHTTTTDKDGWFTLHYPCLYKGYDKKRKAYVFIKEESENEIKIKGVKKCKQLLK